MYMHDVLGIKHNIIGIKTLTDHLIQIRIFDLAEHQGFKCIHKFDVAKEMDKQSSRPSKELSSGIP